MKRIAFLAALLFGAPVLAAPATPKLADLQEILLPQAVNAIERFTPDGRAATVIRAFRDNSPSPHGYTVYMVVIGDDLVNIDGMTPGKPPPREDTVRDWPHNDIDRLWTVRFARATLDGKPETVLITARRDIGGSYPEATRTRVAVHRLVHHEGGNFSTPEVFEPALSFRTIKRYGHADVALLCEIGLPLPADTGAEDKSCPAKRPAADVRR